MYQAGPPCGACYVAQQWRPETIQMDFPGRGWADSYRAPCRAQTRVSRLQIRTSDLPPYSEPRDQGTTLPPVRPDDFYRAPRSKARRVGFRSNQAVGSRLDGAA